MSKPFFKEQSLKQIENLMTNSPTTKMRSENSNILLAILIKNFGICETIMSCRVVKWGISRFLRKISRKVFSTKRFIRLMQKKCRFSIKLYFKIKTRQQNINTKYICHLYQWLLANVHEKNGCPPSSTWPVATRKSWTPKFGFCRGF